MLLRLIKASKFFGGLHALNNLDMEVPSCKILGVIGPNGAGKTTLFNVVTGFHKADSGRVLFEEKEITYMRPDQICRLGIARTFQISRPLGGITVLENTMVGAFLREHDRNRSRRFAMEILDFVGLASSASKRAGDLTIPERKRLELARALTTKPKLLMLDEVFAGLNPSETEKLMGLVRKINGDGVTLVLIEHVMQAVMNLSEHLVVLNYGVKLMEGPPHEIVKNKEVIDLYLGEEYA